MKTPRGGVFTPRSPGRKELKEHSTIATRNDYAAGLGSLQKILKASLSGFFHLCPQDTTSFACLHATSFERQLNIIVRLRTQMNDVALRANDVLRNDVGLRPMRLRFAQTDFSANKKMPIGVFGQGSRSEPLPVLFRKFIEKY